MQKSLRLRILLVCVLGLLVLTAGAGCTTKSSAGAASQAPVQVMKAGGTYTVQIAADGGSSWKRAVLKVEQVGPDGWVLVRGLEKVILQIPTDKPVWINSSFIAIVHE